uniref:Secreted protein n=1 Tax=Achlya hypogyna TaxID=1202772 RepID=A0A0A7CNX8_ACHHY|nr:secreted protein [Achlya hypogyna]
MMHLLLDALMLYGAWHPAPASDDAANAGSGISEITYELPAPPPPFPSEVQATFTECALAMSVDSTVQTFEGYDVPDSSGAWYYQYHVHGAKNWRVDHDTVEKHLSIPQANNFCACAKGDTTETCSLYFTQGNLFVNFPTLGNACCRLCDATTAGCGVLRPDWLSAAPVTHTGVDVLDGRTCYQYCTPGYQFDDCMSYDDYGFPCRYSETWGDVVHNLTFTSWVVQAQRPATFDLPSPACAVDCPKLFPACMMP